MQSKSNVEYFTKRKITMKSNFFCDLFLFQLTNLLAFSISNAVQLITRFTLLSVSAWANDDSRSTETTQIFNNTDM